MIAKWTKIFRVKIRYAKTWRLNEYGITESIATSDIDGIAMRWYYMWHCTFDDYNKAVDFYNKCIENAIGCAEREIERINKIIIRNKSKLLWYRN